MYDCYLSNDEYGKHSSGKNGGYTHSRDTILIKQYLSVNHNTIDETVLEYYLAAALVRG